MCNNSNVQCIGTVNITHHALATFDTIIKLHCPSQAKTFESRFNERLDVILNRICTENRLRYETCLWRARIRYLRIYPVYPVPSDLFPKDNLTNDVSAEMVTTSVPNAGLLDL